MDYVECIFHIVIYRDFVVMDLYAQILIILRLLLYLIVVWRCISHIAHTQNFRNGSAPLRMSVVGMPECSHLMHVFVVFYFLEVFLIQEMGLCFVVTMIISKLVLNVTVFLFL